MRSPGWLAGDSSGWKKPKIAQVIIGYTHRLVCLRYKNVGFSFGYQENCAAKIVLHGKTEVEKATLFHAGAEVGQGTHTSSPNSPRKLWDCNRKD
jgi:hypothetical protein